MPGSSHATTLLWCRRAPLFPIVVFPCVWAAAVLTAPTYILFYGQFRPLQIGLFMAARFARERGPLIVALIVACALLAVDLLVPSLRLPGEVVFHWTVSTMVWSAGFGLQRLERRARESTQRAIETEVGAAEQAMQAVLDERTRIARELHEIVGHAVSSMVVQAGAAQQAGSDEPEFVESALANIRTTGTDALAEMRRLVSMLREYDDAPLTPQPRLDALPAVVESSAGPDVHLEITGQVRPLPAGLDRTAVPSQ